MAGPSPCGRFNKEGIYGRLGRKALLSALKEGRSLSASENCLKLKKEPLVRTTMDRLSGTDWLPPAFRTPAIDDNEVAGDTMAANDEVDELAAAE